MESYSCVVCQEKITDKEHDYTIKYYRMALCRKHQNIQKQIKEKAETEQKTNTTTQESKTVSNPDAIALLTQAQKIPIPDRIQDGLIQRLTQWVNARPNSFVAESKHLLFLEGMRCGYMLI